MPNSEVEKEYCYLLAGDLTFKEWEQLTDACKKDQVSTYSKSSHVCPHCGTVTPILWHIYVREVDKDLIDEA